MSRNGLVLRSSSHTSVGEMAYHSLCVHADKIGHINYDTGMQKLNGQILEEAIKSAQLLRHRFNLDTGDTIGVFVEPDDPLVSITFGAIFNGNPLHFIDPRFDLGEIHQLFEETQPKLVLCGYACKAGRALKASLDKTTVLFVEEFRNLWHNFQAEQVTIQDVNFSRHDTIAIISMSGNADRFELITHDNIVDQKEMPWFEGKTFLSFKSWNVYAEISNLFATTIMGATRVVTRDRFNCKLVREIAEEYEVNLMQLTSYQIQQMQPASVTGYYFNTLDRVLCTGPRITDLLIKFAASCFPNSVLSPHLLSTVNYSPPTTPDATLEKEQSPMDGKKKNFLRNIFRKHRKQKTVG